MIICTDSRVHKPLMQEGSAEMSAVWKNIYINKKKEKILIITTGLRRSQIPCWPALHLSWQPGWKNLHGSSQSHAEVELLVDWQPAAPLIKPLRSVWLSQTDIVLAVTQRDSHVTGWSLEQIPTAGVGGLVGVGWTGISSEWNRFYPLSKSPFSPSCFSLSHSLWLVFFLSPFLGRRECSHRNTGTSCHSVLFVPRVDTDTAKKASGPLWSRGSGRGSLGLGLSFSQ